MSITALAKQKFGKPLAAGALALSLTFSSMAANDAMAADHSANVSTTSPEITFKRQVERVTLPGQFRAIDFTGDKVSQRVKDDAPADASDNRLSITVYGGTRNSKGAAASAGKNFANKLHDVTFVSLDDDDGNPNTARILICADGRCVQEIKNVPNDYDQQAIGNAVTKALFAAYISEIKPYLVDAPDDRIASASPVAGLD